MMNVALRVAAVFTIVLTTVAMNALVEQTKASQPNVEWSLNATVIEACSCPMFCQCYFNSSPAMHMGHDHGTELFCRFNRALKITRGHFGRTPLEGVTFWMAGDLGSDFSSEHYDWAVLRFPPSVTKEQREALLAIAPSLFPGTWNSFRVGEDATLDFHQTTDSASAQLDGGKAAEIVLRKAHGMTSGPVLARNLKYEGAARNDGFVLMPNEVEAYRAGDKAFEYKGTNGFTTNIEISSKDPR